MIQGLIYAGLFLILGIPIIGVVNFKIPRNFEAESFFKRVEEFLTAEEVVFVSLDFGPGTSAENLPQAIVVTEHLLRKNVKIIFLSLTPQSQPFLVGVPEIVTKKLTKEGYKFEYGVDYVIAGFRPAPAVFLQRLALSSNLPEALETDIYGARISSLPISKNLNTLSDVAAWFEFSGIAGMVQNYIQYLNTGSSVKFFHGCTSVIVPEAYIYKDSNQILGLLEGLTGSVAYDDLLSEMYPTRDEYSDFRAQFQSLSLGQLYIVFLIILGNILTQLRNARN